MEEIFTEMKMCDPEVFGCLELAKRRRGMYPWPDKVGMTWGTTFTAGETDTYGEDEEPTDFKIYVFFDHLGKAIFRVTVMPTGRKRFFNG